MNISGLELEHKLVESIATLAQGADGATDKIVLKTIEGDPDRRFLIIKPDGSFEIQRPNPVQRGSKLYSVDQVAPYVLHAITDWKCSPGVYYNTSGVRIELSDGTTRRPQDGSGIVELIHTKEFKLLQKFAEKPDDAWRTQKGFIVMLRTVFPQCFEQDPFEQLLKSLSVLEGMAGERTTGTVMRNRESLGKEIMAEMKTTAGEIPEQVTLQVRLYDDPALLATRSITCLLETDAATNKLALIPVGDQLERAIDEEMTDLGDALRSSINGTTSQRLPGPEGAKVEVDPPPVRQVPVFYGSL